MNHYDIVFIGQMGMTRIFPFQGPSYVEKLGSPVIYAAIAAASCPGKRIAAVTRISESEESLLEPMRSAGVDLFVQPGEVYKYRVVFPTANVDQRQVYRVRSSEPFVVSGVPTFEESLIHLCCIGGHEFQLDLMRALKARKLRLSVDMQGFMFQTDETGSTSLQDVPEKREILRMADFVKLDAVEAQVLTGVDVLREQADILEDWGSVETIITSSEGALVRTRGEDRFVKFTARGTRGRMGRGDTLMGSYLAQRLDHSIEDSLRFAVALTSIKLESPGPFSGSVEDINERMETLPLPIF